MKKVMLFVAALFVVGMFMSCKKDYTCSCEYGGNIPKQDYPIENTSKGDAKDACEKLEATAKMAFDDAKCTLN